MLNAALIALILAAPAPLRAAVDRIDHTTFAVAAVQPLLAERVPNKAERWLLKGCMALNVGGNAYDATTTIKAINSGNFREGNPALRWIGDRPARLLPVKAAYAGGTTWGFIALADRHPRIAAASACISGAVSTWAGATNRRKLRGS